MTDGQQADQQADKQIQPSDVMADAKEHEDGQGAAARTMEAIRADTKPKEVTLTNGVKVRLKPVPPLFWAEAMAAGVADMPKPPMVSVGEGREEPWTGDPKYAEDYAQWQYQQLATYIDVFLIAGLEVLEVPEGVHDFEDDGWQAMARRFKVKIADNPDDRYLQWIKLYILQSSVDINDTLNEIIKMSGITESEVTRAVAAFRSRTRWRSDHGVPLATDPSRNNVPDAVAGNGADDRGTDGGAV